MTRAQDLERLRAALGDRSDVRLAVLFGSLARGTARDTSDIDVAVDGDGLDLGALARDISLAVGREADVVALREVGHTLLQAIVRDGVVVHEARQGAGASWRSAAMAQLETDEPAFERMREAWLRRVARQGLLDG